MLCGCVVILLEHCEVCAILAGLVVANNFDVARRPLMERSFGRPDMFQHLKERGITEGLREDDDFQIFSMACSPGKNTLSLKVLEIDINRPRFGQSQFASIFSQVCHASWCLSHLPADNNYFFRMVFEIGRRPLYFASKPL